MRPTRLVHLVLIVSLCLSASGCAMIHNAAADSIILPYRPSRAELRQHFTRGITPEEYGLQAVDKVIHVSDGIDLAAWFFAADSAVGNVIVLHGFGGAKEQQLGAAEMLLKRHYNVVLFDARGHGASGGRYCTHGVRERHDLVQIIDSAQAAFGAALPLGLMGHSFGGSVVLQTMAIDKRVRCAVVESTYSSLRAAVNDYAGSIPILSAPSVKRASYRLAGQKAGFDPDSASNIWAARRITQPVFLSHGTEDERLDFDNGERIRDALSPELVTWRPVVGAGHNTVWQFGGADYKAEILAFFDKNLKSAGRQ